MWHVITDVDEIESFDTIENAKNFIKQLLDPDGDNLREDQIILLEGKIFNVSRNTAIKISEIHKKKTGKANNEKK
jgi:hypothetical protein